jgi:hypothetical protein
MLLVPWSGVLRPPPLWLAPQRFAGPRGVETIQQGRELFCGFAAADPFNSRAGTVANITHAKIPKVDLIQVSPFSTRPLHSWRRDQVQFLYWLNHVSRRLSGRYES